MKVYLVDRSTMDAFSKATEKVREYIDYRYPELLERGINHLTHQGVPVVTKLHDGMEAVDNKSLMEFLDGVSV